MGPGKGAAKRSKQGARRLSKDQWDLLKEGYRRHPGDHGKAARVAKCDPRTARKAWQIGLTYPWCEGPIRLLIDEERKLARANVENETTQLPQDARKAASDHAARSRGEEALIVQGARRNVWALIGCTAQLTKGAVPLAKRLRKAIETEEDTTLGMRLLRDVTDMTRYSAQTADIVMEMERKLLGDGRDILPDDMTVEQAVKQIEESGEALERFKKAGFKVIAGGKQ